MSLSHKKYTLVSQRLQHLQETSACPPDPLDKRPYPPVGQLGKVVSPLCFDGSLQVGLVNTVSGKKHNTVHSISCDEEGDALVVVICCTFIVALTPFMGAR